MRQSNKRKTRTLNFKEAGHKIQNGQNDEYLGVYSFMVS